jgi:biopolymer transport protein ExbD
MADPAPIGLAAGQMGPAGLGAGALTGYLPDPDRAGARRGFSLMPLADVMFQLLIFFMLSSSLAPYALLSLTAPARTPAEARESPRPAQERPDPATAAQVIWHLERGTVRAGSNRIRLAVLPAALAELREDGIDDIVVFVSDAARAQDIAGLLEPVSRAGFARLQLIGR